VVERSLSIDNLFVFALIFGYFAVPTVYQHRVLMWGVMGALVLRAIFIAAGVTLLEPDDEKLAAWADEGRVLVTLLLWAGMIRELDLIPRLIDLAAETELRAGLLVTAETLEYGAGFSLELLASPPGSGGVLGLLEPLLAGDSNVVFGTRMWSSHAAFSFWYVIGNKGVTLATNLLYNCWISDLMTCHKAMRTDLFRSLRLRERGFGIEPEIAACVLKAGERIYEVPVTYRARSRGAGKKLTAIDGLRVLRTLVRRRIL